MFRRTSAHHIETGGAPGRTRTGTTVSGLRILSPMRLPVSPPGQADNGNTLTNERGGVTVRVHKVRCTAAKVRNALINGSEARSREPALDPASDFSGVDQRLRSSGEGEARRWAFATGAVMRSR